MKIIWLFIIWNCFLFMIWIIINITTYNSTLLLNFVQTKIELIAKQGTFGLNFADFVFCFNIFSSTLKFKVLYFNLYNFVYFLPDLPYLVIKLIVMARIALHWKMHKNDKDTMSQNVDHWPEINHILTE